MKVARKAITTWIGLGDITKGKEANWKWVSGCPFSYTNWYRGYPKYFRGLNYDCVVLSAGKLVNVSCRRPFFTLCEKKRPCASKAAPDAAAIAKAKATAVAKAKAAAVAAKAKADAAARARQAFAKKEKMLRLRHGNALREVKDKD